MVRLLPGDIIDVLLGGDLSAPARSQGAGARAARPQRLLPGAVLALDQRRRPGRLRLLATATPSRSRTSCSHALPITLELVILGLLIAVADRRPARRPLGRQARQRARLRRARRRPRRGQHPELLARDAAAALHLARRSAGCRRSPTSPFFDDPIENLSQFILPAISISVFTLAIVMRMVRATMLEVLGQDYVRTARAKGVQPQVVDLAARAPERADPGRHDRRLRDRDPDGRRGDRRDHLRAARASATRS